MKVRSGASGASAAAVGFVWEPPSSATSRGERPRAARLRDRVRPRLVLASGARRRGRRQDEARRARVRVRSHLGQPLEGAERGRAAQLALCGAGARPGRSGTRAGPRSAPRPDACGSARPAARRARPASPAARRSHRAWTAAGSPALPASAEEPAPAAEPRRRAPAPPAPTAPVLSPPRRSRRAAPAAPPPSGAAASARSPAAASPTARARARPRTCAPASLTASRFPARASVRTPSAARPAAVGERPSASTTVEIDPDRPRPEATLPLRPRDHQPRPLGPRRRPQPPSQLPDRRLVRPLLLDREQAETTHMEAVGQRAQQRLLPPAGAVLSTRSAARTSAAGSAPDRAPSPGGHEPPPRDPTAPRSAESSASPRRNPIHPRPIVRQLPLRRQLVPYTLPLAALQAQHPDPPARL